MKPLPGMLVKPKVGQGVISTEEIYVIVDVAEKNNNIMLKTINYFDAEGDKNIIIPRMFEFNERDFKVIGMVNLD
jgi:hypothetical protein